MKHERIRFKGKRIWLAYVFIWLHTGERISFVIAELILSLQIVTGNKFLHCTVVSLLVFPNWKVLEQTGHCCMMGISHFDWYMAETSWENFVLLIRFFSNSQ